MSLSVRQVYKEALEGCVHLSDKFTKSCPHLSDKSMKRLQKVVSVCLKSPKEVLEGCVYFSDKFSKRVLKVVFICLTYL